MGNKINPLTSIYTQRQTYNPTWLGLALVRFRVFQTHADVVWFPCFIHHRLWPQFYFGYVLRSSRSECCWNKTNNRAVVAPPWPSVDCQHSTALFVNPYSSVKLKSVHGFERSLCIIYSCLPIQIFHGPITEASIRNVVLLPGIQVVALSSEK